MILSVYEFSTYRDLGKKLDKQKLKECIDLGELDLQNIIGIDFYYYILNNQEDLRDLLLGSQFKSGKTLVMHQGIKSILSDLTYARFLAQINVNITPFGATVKQTQDSSPVDRNTLNNLVNQAKRDAHNKWVQTMRYIRSNDELSAIYNEVCNGGNFNNDFNTNTFWLI